MNLNYVMSKEIKHGLRIILRNNGGDDWDDKPYEHNAEEPYDSWSELIEDDKGAIKRKYIHHPIQLKTLYFETNDWTERQPCDSHHNSNYSVEDINNRAIEWLKTDSFSIFAGESYENFISIIEKHGGEIYEKRTSNI